LNGPRADATRRDPALRLVPARCAILFLGVLLEMVVYVWARALFGPTAGLLALALAVTCPALAAHARLVTTDLPAALGFTATTWLAWRWLSVPTWRRAALTGTALGAAILFKFSCALLVPVVVVLALIAVMAGRLDVKRAAFGVVLIAAVAYGSVWAGYGFRFEASRDPDYVLEWEGLAARRRSRPPSSSRASTISSPRPTSSASPTRKPNPRGGLRFWTANSPWPVGTVISPRRSS
jgi:4-amino-4-deoxy-L-arabinose transferase-like glycosyltransferase